MSPATSEQAPTARGYVDADAVAAFALATNDPRPAYLAGTAVPPLFTVSLVLAEYHIGSRRASDLIGGWTSRVHGEHDVRLHRPVVPGEVVEWTSLFHGLRRNRGGVLETQRIAVTDKRGSLLVEHYWSNQNVGGSVDNELGQDKPTHAFPAEARRRAVGTLRVPVDRDQAFRYAGVSGDHAPHAINDQSAREEGFPEKVLQGLCTLAMSSGAMIDLAADGDPTRLRRLAGRFASPVFPKRDLLVTSYDAGCLGDRCRVFAFEVAQDGVPVITHGRVEVAPA